MGKKIQRCIVECVCCKSARKWDDVTQMSAQDNEECAYLCFLSVSWYYTLSQTLKVSVRCLTTTRKPCPKSLWPSPAEYREGGESIFPTVLSFPSVLNFWGIRKFVKGGYHTCVPAGWSMRSKTTRGACMSYLRAIIQICLAWDVRQAPPSAPSRLCQWLETTHTHTHTYQ